MTFFEIPFPQPHDWGSDGGPGFLVSIVGSDSGHETRIARRAAGRLAFNAAMQVRSYGDVSDVISFFRRVGSTEGGFRWKDWTDFTSTSLGRDWGQDSPTAHTFTDQVIGVGDDSTTMFQLVKTYGDTSPQHTRIIEKPVSGTVTIAFDGVEETTGWTVDTTTGIVTFSVAPTLDTIITAGFEFDVPVRFGDEVGEQLRAVATDWGSAAIPSIPLIELLNERSVDDRLPIRPAQFVNVSANTNLSISKSLWALNPTTTGLWAFLPPVTSTESGGPQFCIQNVGANAISIRDYETSTEQFSLSAGANVTPYLGVDSSGDPVWYGF